MLEASPTAVEVCCRSWPCARWMLRCCSKAQARRRLLFVLPAVRSTSECFGRTKNLCLSQQRKISISLALVRATAVAIFRSSIVRYADDALDEREQTARLTTPRNEKHCYRVQGMNIRNERYEGTFQNGALRAFTIKIE